MLYVTVLSFLLFLYVAEATYLDYVHPGQNKSHTWTLNEPYSDEWLGKCVDSPDSDVTEETRSEIDHRTTVRLEREQDIEREGSSFSTKDAFTSKGKSLPFTPKGGDKYGLKVLIVSVDNRDISNIRHPDKGKHSHTAYSSFGAAINNDYAVAHGYDYLYTVLNASTLADELLPKFNCTTELLEQASFGNHKYGPASYHVGYKYMRASSWNKLPALYHLVHEYGHLYDWFLYTDTDVTLNPKYLNRSISETLQEWQSGRTPHFGSDLLPNRNRYVQWGQTDLRKTSMITLTNFPWRDDMPCAGVFLLRPTRQALLMLQDWWNFNIPLKNLYDFMEQDALWYMKEADSDDKLFAVDSEEERKKTEYDGKEHTVNHRGIINNAHLRNHMRGFMNAEQNSQYDNSIWQFSINSSTLSLVYEPQMTSYNHGSNDIQFMHMPNYQSTKLAYMTTFLRSTLQKLHNDNNFYASVKEIMSHHRLELDVLGLVEKMEVHRRTGVGLEDLHSQIQSLKKSEYPNIHRGKADSTWHVFTSSAILNPEKREHLVEDIGRIYNGFAISIAGISKSWLVINGTRHAFPDFDTFVKMGFDLEEVLVFRDWSRRAPCKEREIPEGAPLLPFDRQAPGKSLLDHEWWEKEMAKATNEESRRLGGISDNNEKEELVVPNIVHQTYDYQAPNYFLYMSLLTAQHYLKPEKHILWVNDEGRFRMGHWHQWTSSASAGSWEKDLVEMFDNGKIQVKFVTFPGSPPGNSSTHVSNKAHRSDFLRLRALREMGGIYLDTDVFCARPLHSLRVHDFTMGFDNVVHEDENALNARRLNNGVILSAPNASFIHVWEKAYSNFDPNSFDYHSSVLPLKLAVQYPDLIHIEMSRVSPMSYGLQTSEAAAALTCGILLPKEDAIWYPVFSESGGYSFSGVKADRHLYSSLRKKLVFHMTMSGVRGISMLRKNLGPADVDKMPSLLGRIFRVAISGGYDTYDYSELYSAYDQGVSDKPLSHWNQCREMLGMFTPLDTADSRSAKHHPSQRQQYVSSELP